MEGYWLEVISESEERRYSIGLFKYHKNSQALVFDGVNYLNSGEIFCTWRSINVHVDSVGRKIYYIFRASLCDAQHSENYGFGVVNITETKNGDAFPESGHFIEAKANGKPLSHSMIPLNTVIEQMGLKMHRTDSEEIFHSRIINQFHKFGLYNKSTKSKVE